MIDRIRKLRGKFGSIDRVLSRIAKLHASLSPSRRNVFICYHRDDTGSIAASLCSELRRRLPGVEVFRDVETLSGGQNFGQECEAAIAKAGFVVVLIGRGWDDTPYVLAEIRAANQYGCTIVPVFVDLGSEDLKRVRERMSQLDGLESVLDQHGLPLRQTDFDSDLLKLAKTLGASTSDFSDALIPCAIFLGVVLLFLVPEGRQSVQRIAEATAMGVQQMKEDLSAAVARFRTAPALSQQDASRQHHPAPSCKVLDENFGRWKPTRSELSAVTKALAPVICGDQNQGRETLSTSLDSCAIEVESTTFQVELYDRTASRCDLKVLSASWNDHRWVWVGASWSRNGKVGSQINVIEVTQEPASHYAYGWTCPTDAGTLMGRTPPGSGLVSLDFVADWSRFPARLRTFFCGRDRTVSSR